MVKLETAAKDIHEKLVEGCKAYDRNAQIRLYELYNQAMYNTSLRIVGHTAVAEDIMQDSFIEAFKKIGEFRGEGTIGSWLKRIVINRSINHVRKAQNITSIEEKEIDVEDNTTEEDQYSENIFCRLEEIREAIDRLPDSYRTIISLHLLEGYDHREIAEILETTHGNVRTRYSRAKQKLLHIIMELRKQ